MSIPININDISKKIKDNFSEIPFALIFGSQVNGKTTEYSDIDIAIWYNGNDVLIKIKVLEVLDTLILNKSFDIVNINAADPLLAHEALAGKVLFVRENQKSNYADFYTKIAAEYEDRIFWIKKQLQYRGYEVQWSN